MALIKRNYVSGKTVITAENLNEIQDSIIELESNGGVGMGNPVYSALSELVGLYVTEA